MQTEIGDRERRRDLEYLTDRNADKNRDERDRRALITHKAKHQRRDRHTQPDLRLDKPDAERGEGQPEAELQASSNTARQSAG